MEQLENLCLRYPVLRDCEESIRETFEYLVRSFVSGGRLYICGNGGSASDALHIIGELGKSFVRNRALDEAFLGHVDKSFAEKLQGALPAFALVENSALSTAYENDVDAAYVFAQQVYAYAREGDCVLGISTSGNSVNVLNALIAARGRGAAALGLTGRDGGKMKSLCDTCIIVPETETDRKSVV